ncbi:hypothetical protein HanIR_Chr11g0542671 [Helianthus annuus]|nr:hypothetical protein HanIR_Chr11g0542671 [Helianthus annuus]
MLFLNQYYLFQFLSRFGFLLVLFSLTYSGVMLGNNHHGYSLGDGSNKLNHVRMPNLLQQGQLVFESISAFFINK